MSSENPGAAREGSPNRLGGGLVTFLIIAAMVVLGRLGLGGDRETDLSDISLETLVDAADYTERGMPQPQADVLARGLSSVYASFGSVQELCDFIRVDCQNGTFEDAFVQSSQAMDRHLLIGTAKRGGSAADSLVAVLRELRQNFMLDECARVASGTADSDILINLMARMDTTWHKRRMSLLASAVNVQRSELGSAPMGYTEEEAAAAFVALLDAVAPEDRQRFESYLDSVTASPADDCWADEVFWGAAATLPHAELSTILTLTGENM